jgi:ABC-2 type transport system permease protein
MTHWFNVFQYELRRQFRSKAYLFFTFVIPLLALGAFFGYRALTSGNKNQPSQPINEVNQANKSIGYVDLTGLFPGPESYPAVNCSLQPNEVQSGGNLSAISRIAMIKRITSPYCLSGVVTAYDSVQAGQAALDANKIDALYVIEPDFATTGNVSVYVKQVSIEHMDTQTVIQDYLNRSALYNVDPVSYEQLYLRLRDPAVVTENRISQSGAVQTQNENQNFALVYGFGLLMMLGMMWGGGYLMQSVVQEKESRIIEIMLSSVRPTALLAGKILAMGLLALLQIGMLAGTFIFILSQAGSIFDQLGNVEVEPVKLALMIVYFVLGFLFFGSLMATIGALSTSMRESQNFVVFVTLPAAVPFFFLSIFVDEPNGMLATVLSMIPFTAPLSMTMRIAVTDVAVGQLVLSLGLLVLGVAGAIWLAGRMFRVNTLLAGTMPRLRDLPRLIVRG